MSRGGSRPGSGPKKKKVVVPIELIRAPVPSASASTPTTQELLLAKLNELALSGDPVALRLALAELPKLALYAEQTRALRLKNVILRDLALKKGLPLAKEDLEFEPTEEDIGVGPVVLKLIGEK